MNAKSLRKYMVELKMGLSEKCQEVFNATLGYYWLTRFDQQNTTKYHRDNAPDNSYLMLGYEPSAIESRLLFADYHRLVTENNIPTDKYYELYNPMFEQGEKRLRPYVTELKGFNNEAYNLVVINNSNLNSDKTRGVLHKAEIRKKDLNRPRIVNSVMLYLKSLNDPEENEKEKEMRFIRTEEVNS